MMYGVLVCSRCERARAVNLSQKTSTCECGSRIDVRQSKPYYKSDSQRDVAEAVRQVNARISGAPAVNLAVEIDSSETRKDLLATLRESLRDEVKSRRQLEAILAGMGIKDPDKTIDGLLADGILYEPEKDRLRLV